MKKGTSLRTEIDRVQNLKPKQYQQGWTEFYKLKFKLTPDVLIPRPETEILVDEVLDIVNRKSVIGKQNDTRQPISDIHTVLDIGTGSGCIAISVAKNSPSAKVIAVDISPKALAVAKQNAKFNKVEKQVFFIESDLLSYLTNIHTGSGGIKVPDIIVTNLPYIPTARLMLIDPMVTEWEPRIALDGGIDGFELYRKLFSQMKERNFYPKFLIAEIDEEQADIALAESKKYFPNAKAEIKQDLYKKDRILIISY